MCLFPSVVKVCCVSFALLSVPVGVLGVPPLAPTGLHCEYCSNPLGIDAARPKLGWVVRDADRGEHQTAYQILVATSPGKLKRNIGDMWDSGKVASDRQIAVAYAGRALASKTRYWWKVRTWDNDGNVGPYSKPAWFETAMLSPSDWRAKWIGGKFGLIRKEFVVNKPVEHARVYVTGLGYYECRINGRKVGDHVLDPVTSDVRKRMRYATYDVSDMIVRGKNAIGLMLGDAWYGPNHKAICQVEVWHPDGTKTVVVTDETWKGAQGPVLSNSIYHGETYDATREQPGWDRPNFDDSAWKLVPVVSRIPGWCFDDGVAVADGCDEALLNRGHDWTDYTFEFDAMVVRRTAGWVFRAQDEGNLYMWQVFDKTAGPQANRLRIHKKVSGIYKVIDEVDTGLRIEPQKFYHIKMALHGDLIETYIDGKLVDRRRDGTFRSGTVGFRESSGEKARFDNLKVVGDGWTFADPLDRDLGCWGRNLQLTAELEPIKVMESIEPARITEPEKGVYVFDMGQNFAGWVRLTVQGPRGTRVRLRFAELLYPDGMINRENLRSARATDLYVLKGEGTEVYEPHFTYHGFRYVEVTGFPGVPTKANILGRVVHSAVDRTGEFKCSNDLLNRIFHICLWAQRSNLYGIPTDCPQRDERLGWTGDAMVSAYGMMMNLNMTRFFSKWFVDMDDVQTPAGCLADVILPRGGGTDPPWQSVNIVAPWDFYINYDDALLLRQHYKRMKRFVDYLTAISKDHIVTQNSYGDWIAPEPTPKDLISTGYYLLDVQLLSRIAEAIGEYEDASAYARLANKIADAFNKRFLDRTKHFYGNNSQFSNALPLYLGIVPKAQREGVIKNLVENVEKRGRHLSTGTLGTKFILRVLTDVGRMDLAYAIATQKTYPSWGYMIKHGATTLWELWELKTGNGMNSHNHHMLSPIVDWLYHDVAGLSSTASGPGFGEIVVRPRPVSDLKSARASIETLRGRAACRWEKSDDGFSLNVTVPVNSTARVFVPTLGHRPEDLVISEKGEAVWKQGTSTNSKIIQFVRKTPEYIVFRVGSGLYKFRARRR